MSAEVLFALATALHAGFQLTVTALVYPALVDVGTSEWKLAHARHSRRITPVVGLVYGSLVASAIVLLVAGDAPGPLLWLGLGTTAGALAVTAGLAAPLHGRLTDGEPDLRRQLIRVDRLRCVFAVAGAVLSVLALLV